MVWDGPYAGVDDYKARGNVLNDNEAPLLQQQLVAVTRYIESPRRCNRRFNQTDANVVRYFDSWAEDLLDIDDLVTLGTAGIQVDVDGDGVFEVTLAPADLGTLYAFEPWNAAEDGKPFEIVRLLQTSGNSTLRTFPERRRAVKVTATWGFAAVPPAIREATVLLTRQLRDLEKFGFTQVFENIDQSVQSTPGGVALLMGLMSQYSRSVPAVA